MKSSVMHSHHASGSASGKSATGADEDRASAGVSLQEVLGSLPSPSAQSVSRRSYVSLPGGKKMFKVRKADPQQIFGHFGLFPGDFGLF